MQCDLWFSGKVIPVDVDAASRTAGWVGGRPAVDLPVLTMVAAFSGFIMATLLPTRKTGDLVAGMWQLLAGLGGVPKMLVWDNRSQHRPAPPPDPRGARLCGYVEDPDLPDRGT